MVVLNESFAAGYAMGAVTVAIGVFIVQRSAASRRRAPETSIPAESTIRLMTRLAIEHGAINLSQGFPNEPPPRVMSLAAAGALLDGESMESAERTALTLERFLADTGSSGGVAKVGRKDVLNQYSFPAGMPALRQEISRHYNHYHPALAADPEANVTVVLGATEGFAVCLRALCKPGDTVAMFEPYHELYPSQCVIWGLRPRAVTLREAAHGGWAYDRAELRAALAQARVLLLNTPHNPTGKVFSRVELEEIAALCIEMEVLCVTDEIYEHLVYGGRQHLSPALLPGMAHRTCVVNAISKSASATGWRVGWVISPEAYTPAIRACHDQLVVQAPTPLQVGALACLRLGPAYFDQVAMRYEHKCAVLMKALRSSGFDVRAPPEGAYYLFVGFHGVPALRGLTPHAAAVAMIERHGVACVPGDNFYLMSSKTDPTLGGYYLRFTFVRSLDVLEQAAHRLQAMGSVEGH